VYDAFPKGTTKFPTAPPIDQLFTHQLKGIFHFLILPRVQNVQGAPTVSELSDLRTLLAGDKARAKEVLTALSDDAKTLRTEIEAEMLARYGFKWGML
jgi:aprataxin